MLFLRKFLLLSRLFWVAMALSILNVSVDSPDIILHGTHEDLSINDMESVVEIVMEKLFSCQDAIREYDELDEDGGTTFFVKKDIGPYIRDCQIVNQPCELSEYQYSGYLQPCYLQFNAEVTSPPPRA